MNPARSGSKTRRWRRQFLKAGAIFLTDTLALPHLAKASQAAPPARLTHWRNWSGTEQCQAKALLTPANGSEIAELLRQDSGPVRCVGAGHSFSPLVPTEGTILSLDRLSGILAHDKANQTVTVAAGTRLAVLMRQLDSLGYAMRNQPDIDQQSLAGAISSATHGTGLTLPPIHADVQKIKLVTAQGETIECSQTERPDLLAAARVSLGCLGVITEITLKVIPAYNLTRSVWLEPLDSLLGRAHDLAQKHRNFEFYYLPFTGYCAAITHDVTTSTEVITPASQDEDMLRDLQKLRDWAGNWPGMRRWLAGKLIDANLKEHAQNRAYKLLSNPRPTRFYETESHVPRDAGIDCVRAVIAQLERRNDIFFPLEFRFVKADDAWLSPFYQRDSCSIAVHALHGEKYDYLLSEIGPVVRKFKARPHWGKLHAFTSTELAALYPRFGDFQQLRRSLDPRNRFLNPHLQKIFGVPA